MTVKDKPLPKKESKPAPPLTKQPSAQGQPQTARVQPAKKQKAVIPSNLFG